jgi:hypothetical protein
MRRLGPLLATALAFALAATLGFFFFRDNFSTHFPFKEISARAWRAGEIPWWNDADAGGQPLAGNPNALTFYPDNFLYLLLPAHVAFNLHFLLHLAAGWLAMRALTRGSFGAWLWVLCGAAMSVLAFYNLVVAFAMIPLALLATEKRSAPLLALSFGLLMLAGEPVTIAATALACAIVGFGRFPLARAAAALGAALVIVSPQVIAYSEIAGEVERARGYSAQTALNASFDPRRLLEIAIGPFFRVDAPHLFPTLVVGLIAIPALFRRSRYVAVAAAMLFFALGRFNPLVRAAVESVAALRAARYPEKFALPMCAALVVLAAAFAARSRARRFWVAITIVQLLAWGVFTIPIDWWLPYSFRTGTSGRIFVQPLPGGQALDRAEYHERAWRLEPLFGAGKGVEYVLNRSGDGMHSLLSRIAAERWASTRKEAWMRIATAPDAAIVPHAAAAPSIGEAVRMIEGGEAHVAPVAMTSSPGASIRGATRDAIDVTGPALLFVNQSYFRAWVARSGERELETLPLDLDRLGVVVPAGEHHLTLRFGRRRTGVVAAWVASSLLIVALLLALRIEVRNRGAGEVERSGDDDALLA